MSKDIELRIEIQYGDVSVERIISSKTTINIGGEKKMELTDYYLFCLSKALNSYMRANAEEGGSQDD